MYSICTQALLAERTMLQSEVSSLRNDIHALGQQLQEVKRKLFTQVHSYYLGLQF
jgi:prefoldin subunit 5